MSLKMAPIKIHIKSSSADIAEQLPAEAVPLSGSESSGKELTDTVKDASASVKDTKDAGLELTTEAESTGTDKVVVSAEDPTADIQSEKDDGDAKQVPDQDKVDSDLYEYEGDDVYFTNPTTKGRYVVPLFVLGVTDTEGTFFFGLKLKPVRKTFNTLSTVPVRLPKKYLTSTLAIKNGRLGPFFGIF
jgi:hypothetical protein